ncbi:uncharacterized protein LOC119983016 isoform X2 [Tripterygium wilfordii]|nr:uncharacterized protein LOC119983016 isoform X2 [Tripterygium wilfordii]
MDKGSSMQRKGRTKRERRTWTNLEENAFVDCLEEAVSKGFRCGNGTFKAGTLTMICAAMNAKFPNANIKVKPHIESTMKRLKTSYSLVCDMKNMRSFRWNDERKCIEVDSDDIWEAYVQSEPRAKKLRGMPMPLFDRLANVFDKDIVHEQEAEAPAAVVEELHGEEERDVDNVQMEHANPSMSVNQSQSATSNKETGSRDRKRTKSEERPERTKSEDMICSSISELKKEITSSFSQVSEQLEMIVHELKHMKDNYTDQRSDRRSVPKELKNMDLTNMERVTAARKIMENPGNVYLFWEFEGDDRVLFVKSFLQ